MNDRELAALVAPVLQRKLREAGFKTGTSSDHHSAFYIPINLDLAGYVSVIRYEDGTWIFSQEVNSRVAERLGESLAMHVEVLSGAAP